MTHLGQQSNRSHAITPKVSDQILADLDVARVAPGAAMTMDQRSASPTAARAWSDWGQSTPQQFGVDRRECVAVEAERHVDVGQDRPAAERRSSKMERRCYAGGTHLAATLVAIRELRPLTDTDAPPVTNPMRATRASSMATGWDCVIFTVVSRGHPIGGHDRWPLPAVSGWPANTCRRRRLTGGMATPRLAPGPRCVAAWSDGRLATTSRRLADLAGLATDGSCGARKLGQAV